MPDTVMTLGRQRLTALLRGTDATPAGDYREVSFHCHFSGDAVNSGPPPAPGPRIRVHVSGPTAERAVVELHPPSGTHETPGARRRVVSLPWARPLVMQGAGSLPAPGSGGLLRSTLAPRWVSEDPFEDPFADSPELVPPLAPPLPPGGGGGGSGVTVVRALDPAVDPVGTWRVRVRNRESEDAQFTITVDYPETVQLLRETRIPFQLINRVFTEAMLALGLRFNVDHGQARISFDAGFKALTGIDDLVFSVSDRIQDINLEQYNIQIQNEGETPVIFAGLDLEERGDEIGLPGPNINIEDMAIALRVLLAHSYARGPDFFATAMRREGGRIVHRDMAIIPFLDAHPDLEGLWASFADAILGVTGALGFTESSLAEYVQDAISEAEQKLGAAFVGLGRYFYDVIAHLAEREHVMHRVMADDDALIVYHHARPGVSDFLDILSADRAGTVAVAQEAQPADRAGAPDAAGPEPATVRDRPARTRQSPGIAPGRRPAGAEAGVIDHIVVLMLENRSFDHMLGYRGLADTNVNGLSGGESNVLEAGIPPYRVFHLSKTHGIRSPDHGFEATIEQIAGGGMTGFVANYARRHGVTDPSMVMSYYTGTELPMYEFLANNYAICDNWHSAHPGETMCNRFCALTGRTPELDNFDVSDPRIAYYDATTVFDHLTELGIDWVYAEGNVAFLRMFDRYRIDVSHVIPFRDDFSQGIEDTFEARVADGRLPAVSFVDPRYIDVPPSWDANDDLPPADVCRGQRLVRRLYQLLSAAPTWDHTLLVITYDEHGGFYDHSPPIGTPLSADPNPVSRVHPDGADHFGVRVPAFLVTPWIDAGTVVHTMFDHTSIIKTILERFAPEGFPIGDIFGERAAAANGLIAGLRTNVRVDNPAPPEFPCTAPTGPAGPTVDLARADFHTGMRLLGVPRIYRSRVTSYAAGQ
jgi:phospholipase C